MSIDGGLTAAALDGGRGKIANAKRQIAAAAGEPQALADHLHMADRVIFAALTWGWALLVVTIGEVLAMRNIIKGRQSEHWPTVPAIVTEAFSRNWFGRHTPVVRYRYEWLGTAYLGSRIAFARVVIPSKASADAFLRQFQLGSTVEARANPRRPSESVLRAGSRVQNWVEAICAAVFGGLVAFIAFGK